MSFDAVRDAIVVRFGNDAGLCYDKTFNPNQFPIEFIGMNCNDSIECCDGWDGLSTRCNCGNRRVDWIWEPIRELPEHIKAMNRKLSGSTCDFRPAQLYAEAY